jgi:hypothetical protein
MTTIPDGNVKCLFCSRIIEKSNARFIRGNPIPDTGLYYKKYADSYICFECLDILLERAVLDGHKEKSFSTYDYENNSY